MLSSLFTRTKYFTLKQTCVVAAVVCASLGTGSWHTRTQLCAECCFIKSNAKRSIVTRFVVKSFVLRLVSRRRRRLHVCMYVL